MKNETMITIHDDIIRLIAVYLAGNASDQESVALQEWIALSPVNKAFFQQLKNIWESSDKKTDFSSISTEKALDKVLARISATKKVSAWFYWQKVAAVLLIPLLLANVLWFTFLRSSRVLPIQAVTYNEIFSAFGTRSSIQLSDGSQVWLNSGSSLRYPDKFANNNRVVYLKGEAYFEVHSDKTKPFIVQTQSVSVTATGTKFNVNAFSNNKEVEVTLASGKVAVAKTGGQKELISELRPNQHLVYDTLSSSAVLETDDDVYKYISWKDGKMIFRNEPLANVVKKINQIYNVNIVLKGSSIQEYRYRATFENESLNEILNMLKLTAPIDYKETKRKIKDDGTFTAKEIIIYKK